MKSKDIVCRRLSSYFVSRARAPTDACWKVDVVVHDSGIA